MNAKTRRCWAFLACAVLAATGVVLVAIIRLLVHADANAGGAPLREGPVLEIDKAAIDFGVVEPGSALAGRFRLTNRGTRRLELSNLKTSCGCTPATLAEPSLGPGASTDLKVTFRVPSHSGPVSHQITMASNDAARAHTILFVKAVAQWAVQASLPRIEIPSMADGATESRQIEVFTADGKPFDVTKTEATAPWIRVDPKLKEPHRQQFVVTLQPKKIGRFQESIRFSTTVQRRPLVIVSVEGEVVGPVRVAPSCVMLGVASPGSVKQTRIVVQCASANHDVRSLAVEDPEWEIVRWETRDEDRRVAIVSVDLRTPRTPGYKRTHLLVEHVHAKEVSKVLVTCLVSEIDSTDARLTAQPPGVP